MLCPICNWKMTERRQWSSAGFALGLFHCKDCECDLRTLQGTDDCMVCEGTNNIEEYNQTVLEFPKHKYFCRGYKICYTNAICLLCKECREKAMLMTMIPSGWDDWDILDEICQSIKNSIK